MKLKKIWPVCRMMAALFGSATTSSFALPTSEVEVVYFSNATYTREVGHVFRGCQGELYRQGTTSRYQARSSTPCQGGQSLNEIACYVNGIQTTCPANLCESTLFDCQ